MRKEVLTIAVCGEVDHGKSTLLGRLLRETNSLPDGKWKELKRICRQMYKDIEPAFLLDQFEEERDEEMTIDTTQVFFKTRKRRYCFIDTPGHIEFIKNMMTGATQAQAAVLIVDVTKGVQEQTCRHARLLKLFGVSRIIVAVNKMDLAGFSQKKFQAVRKNILDLLKRLDMTSIAVIPIVAKEGHNISRLSARMKWHHGPTIIKALDSIRAQTIADGLPLRFPVQDVYRFGGENVCVGRMESGYLKRGQKVAVLPDGSEAEIKDIKVLGSRKNIVRTGESIGIVLRDTLCKRGDVICSKEHKPTPVAHFEGRIFWLGQSPLKAGDTVTLRCATQETEATLEKIHDRMDPSSLDAPEMSGKAVKKNELARATFKTSDLFVVENFNFIQPLGRFVLENKGVTCGFGVHLG